MERRKRNNIIIGTLCAVLVLMGVGYAILSTTLNIGGTANVKGDFDIHFTRIERSSSTITDSTLLSTMDNGTGITENTSNHEGTFTAVLQKPTDYVIYDVEVANTGSIDGYLTFTFGDTNSNFNYYKDFYSVEFIRDDVDPEIKADILQNGTFTDSEVLENTTGERTYKIKVMFKESATSFPDATTNGAFECSLNLTYSQQAPSGGNSGGNTESNITWYAVEIDGEVGAFGLEYDDVNDKYDIRHYIGNGMDMITQLPSGMAFVPYDSSITIDENQSGLTPQNGDYVWIYVVDGNQSILLSVMRNNVLYIDSHGEAVPFNPDSNGSLEKYLGNSGNEQSQDGIGGTYAGTSDGSDIVMQVDESGNIIGVTVENSNILAGLGENPHFEPYDSSIDYTQYLQYSDYSPAIGNGDYIFIIENDSGPASIRSVLRGSNILLSFGGPPIILIKQ